jgi:hypothetical protein
VALRLSVLGHRTDPPPTRAHCILFDEATRAAGYMTWSKGDRVSGRAQCQATSCPFNLLIRRSEDRPGRRHAGLAPEFSTAPLSASAPSCALDVIDANPSGMSCEQIAAVMNFKDKRRVEQILRGVLKSDAGVELYRLLSRDAE